MNWAYTGFDYTCADGLRLRGFQNRNDGRLQTEDCSETARSTIRGQGNDGVTPLGLCPYCVDPSNGTGTRYGTAKRIASPSSLPLPTIF
jgi:hypothetical protein